MLNQQSIIALAKQGDVQAIADMMNYHFNPKQIQVKVSRQNHELRILLEASTVPSQEKVIPPIRGAIKKLGLTDVSVVRVAGRQQGESHLNWKTEVELSSPLPSPGPSLATWLEQGPSLDQQPAITPDGAMAVDQERFLRFYVNDALIALIQLERIQEILQISAQDLLPVPHMAEFVLGVHHYRGEIVWFVDLSQQLGIDSPLDSHRFSKPLIAIVIQHHTQRLGLVIPQILGIESHANQQISPPNPDVLSTQLLPFVQGYFAQPISLVLQVDALLNDRRLQVRQPC